MPVYLTDCQSDVVFSFLGPFFVLRALIRDSTHESPVIAITRGADTLVAFKTFDRLLEGTYLPKENAYRVDVVQGDGASEAGSPVSSRSPSRSASRASIPSVGSSAAADAVAPPGPSPAPTQPLAFVFAANLEHGVLKRLRHADLMTVCVCVCLCLCLCLCVCVCVSVCLCGNRS